MRRTQYYECPLCGAHLDFGEKCDCRDETNRRKETLASMIRLGTDGQYTIDIDRVDHDFYGKAAGKETGD